MKIALWLLIWLMFGASLLGLMLATALWTRKAREIVVSMWLKAKIKEETPNVEEEVYALYEELLRRLFFNRKAKVSKGKTILLAMISSSLVALSVPFIGDKQLALKVFGSSSQMAAWILGFGLFSLPSHWLIEYQFAVGFTKTYTHSKIQSMRALLLKSTAVGIARMPLAVSVLILFAGAVLFAYMDAKPLPDLAVLVVSPGLSSGLFFFPLSLGLSFSPTYPEAPIAAVFSFLSLCISFLSSLALLLYAIVTRNRAALRALAAVCERLDSLSAPSVFAISMTLFALATGAMQAFTFPTSLQP